jgi:hypothetical protein
VLRWRGDILIVAELFLTRMERRYVDCSRATPHRRERRYEVCYETNVQGEIY